ncbi:MAG TPA: class I SAM-dependent methyltransferase [Jiangellaceae bacterium]
MPSPADRDFAEAWDRASRISGWLTRDQAHDLWSTVRTLAPNSTIVEIGSHQGRSTVVLADAATVTGSTVVAVDPFVDGAKFGGRRTRALFERHIEQAGLDTVVRLEAEYSWQVLRRWHGPVALVYIDGKHDYWSCTRDIGWVVHMDTGAPVLVHDAFSSVGVTASLVREQLRRTPRLRYGHRTGSLATFVVGSPAARDRLLLAVELGWFCRNVMIKLLLRLRLRPLARLMGHDSPYDPF